MIPGSNLLKRALTVIKRTPVEYYQYTGRVLNSIRNWVPSYAAPVVIYGSLQPVPRSMYESNGLDFSKLYFTFYTTNNILTTERNVSGDYFIFNNERYQCEQTNDWHAVDGWAGVLCVLQIERDE